MNTGASGKDQQWLTICTACGEGVESCECVQCEPTFPSMNRTYWALILLHPNRLGYRAALGGKDT